MDGISDIAQRYNLTIIEDASESLGAKYKNRMVGRLADIACFSFNGNKIITTGGGGMIATDNDDWSRRAKYLTTQSKDDPIEYIHNEIGYNYRLTNIQAAIGVAQLEHISEHINVKRRMAARYSKCLSIASGITPMEEATWAHSTYWMYTIMIDPKRFGVNRCKLLQLLNNDKIQARPLWQPIHLSPAHKALQIENCTVAEEINASALSLPSSVGLTDSQQDKVIETILRLNK
jgi:perosamine synthetase